MNNIKNINYPKQLIFKGDLTLLVSKIAEKAVRRSVFLTLYFECRPPHDF